MSNSDETFATAVGCMDGRVQTPVSNYAKKKWGVKYVDTITEAGLVKHFAKHHPEHPHEPVIRETVKIKIVDVSVKKHHSQGIVVHGHQECAGNPVDDERQKSDILEAARIIRELEHGKQVIPLFVVRSSRGWKVQEIK